MQNLIADMNTAVDNIWLCRFFKCSHRIDSSPGDNRITEIDPGIKMLTSVALNFKKSQMLQLKKNESQKHNTSTWML